MNGTQNVVQGLDGDWYWIPIKERAHFDMCVDHLSAFEYLDEPCAFDVFELRYGRYRTGGSPECVPEYYKSSALRSGK